VKRIWARVPGWTAADWLRYCMNSGRAAIHPATLADSRSGCPVVRNRLLTGHNVAFQLQVSTAAWQLFVGVVAVAFSSLDFPWRSWSN